MLNFADFMRITHKGVPSPPLQERDNKSIEKPNVISAIFSFFFTPTGNNFFNSVFPQLIDSTNARVRSFYTA